MPESVIAPVTFIGGERNDTRAGKERYLVTTNDGREFSCWSSTVFEGVMAHLHEQLNAKIYSKQGDNGRWWHTLDGLPDLGLESPRQGQGQQSTGPQSPPGASSVDVSALVAPLERIALTLENLLAFRMDQFLQNTPGDLSAVPDDEEPPE